MKVLVTQSCLTLCDPMDCSPPGSSVHGILQARILEWVAIPFSRESSQSRDWIQVSCIAGRFFYNLSHHGSPQITLHPAYTVVTCLSWSNSIRSSKDNIPYNYYKVIYFKAALIKPTFVLQWLDFKQGSELEVYLFCTRLYSFFLNCKYKLEKLSNSVE